MTDFLHKKVRIAFLLLILNAQVLPVFAQSPEIASPDGKLQVIFSIQNTPSAGSLYYQVSYQGSVIVAPSRLHMNLQTPDKLMQPLQIFRTSTSRQDTTWQPVYGERSQVRDHYQELVLHLRNVTDTTRYFQVIARAYNQGVAFRYNFPEQLRMQNIGIAGEQSYFTFPEGTKALVTPHAQGEYQLLALTHWKETAERPLTLLLPNNLYACVAEAQMVNYSRMKLRLHEPNMLVSELDGPVTESTPFSTPWRLVMVAEKPGQLLENNDIMLNLNPPNALTHTGWIKPGKVIREVTLSTSGAKETVDFAATHGLQYIHFDAGWYGHEYEAASDATTVTVDPRRNPKGDLDLPEAIRYAKSKGIGVFLYVNHRALERQLDSILPLYKKWGVAGIKFGFVHTGSHRWTTWLHEAVRKCAAYQLMVNIHDDYRPTGFSRTYPNLMSQEGIRGNEEFPDATHNTILPFTRYIAGAADYTFCYYYRREFGHENRFIRTTPAHQLALPVVYYSPLQWLFWYDRPSSYQGEPEIAFWEKIPTVWDDTQVIQGEIGQYITVARRNGNTWYIGTITNTDGRTLAVPLKFLEKGKKYVAYMYEDGDKTIPTRTHVQESRYIVDHTSILKTVLLPSGGQAILITPASREEIRSLPKWKSAKQK